MEKVLDLAELIFNPLIKLGPAPLMLIVMTLAALFFRVKPGRALEGGIKLAIAIVGIGQVIGLLTTAFNKPLKAFVESTGIELTIADAGWAPLGTITWSSPYTLFFLMVLVIVNIAMLLTNKTNTLDVDIFDVWHLAFTGLFCMFCGANLLIATILVIFIGILKIINADLMKPTFNDLLNAPESSPMTTTHMNYMMNPVIMVFDKIFDRFFSRLDKYDFDAATLNRKIGFWGSKFAIGIYLGLFIGILGKQKLSDVLTLAFAAGACLELFSEVGKWFIAAVEPLSQGIADFANKKLNGRQLNIGLDWPFIAGRAEIWAAANILAPIMLVMSLILPGNKIMPMAGIIAVGLTPALLVVTRGKIIRMVIIGTIELPIFLWAATLVAPFVTETAEKLGAFPAGMEKGTLVSFSTMEGPIEKFLAYLVGNASTGEIKFVMYAALALVAYLAIFLWYKKEMEKRNEEYRKALEAKKQPASVNKQSVPSNITAVAE